MRIAVALCACLLLIGNASAASKADLAARTLDGQKVRLKDIRGNLVVLNLWATWCAPCREELPLLVKTAKQSTVTNLMFIAVSVDDTDAVDKVRAAAHELGITFPVWIGANADDLFRLSKAEVVPATIFIDRDGTIAARVSGEIRETELIERIDWLSGNRTGSRPKEFISHVK